VYVAVSGASAVYAEQFAVDTVDAGLNVEELFAAVASTDGEAVFIWGLEAFATLYGPDVLHMVLRILFQTARGGRAVVISLRDLHDLDMLFDVIVKMEEKNAMGVRGPSGKIGEKVRC
jgi:circadian clock protein KaiC